MALAKYYEDNRIINEERATRPQSFFSESGYRWKPSIEVLDEEYSVGIYYPESRQTLFKRVHAVRGW